jgi:molybdenum cofactor cytidylyltransferase
VEIIQNCDYELGLSSSIKKGLNFIKSKGYDAILIMLADQPKVDTDYLNHFIDEIQKQPSKIIASSYSGISGVPAIFPKAYFNQLLHLKGDQGAKQLLNSPKSEVISFTTNKLTDIDTKQDYLDYLNSI